MRYAIGLVILSLTLAVPALAQEHSGNWWVNPQTGRTERLDLNNPLRQVSSTQVASSDWIEIAQLSGGDHLLVKPSSVRQRQLPSQDAEIVFRARFQSDRRVADGSNRDEGTYAAACLSQGLTRLSDSQIQTSFDVPTLPGTAGGALLEWACRQ